jgi:outer membrane receptor protein involved in Fe transport
MLLITSEKNLIRLAYGQSINRPEFREIAPFAFFDFVTNRVVKGNPTLVDCNIHNIDLRYEYYPTPSEIVSIAGFYKLFNNPIEVVFEGGANTTPNINFQNGDKAVSAGVEIEVRKNLAGNTGSRFLDKLNVVFNAAWIYSKVTLKEDIAASQSNNRPLQGQSPYILNFGLNYNDTKKDLQLNLLYNVIGKRIYAVGFNNGGGALYPDWYELPRNVVDITFAKGIGERFILKGGINDLLNEPNVILQDGNQDGNLDSANDQIIQSFKTGRLYSLGISYKIFGK